MHATQIERESEWNRDDGLAPKLVHKALISRPAPRRPNINYNMSYTIFVIRLIYLNTYLSEIFSPTPKPPPPHTLTALTHVKDVE